MFGMDSAMQHRPTVAIDDNRSHLLAFVKNFYTTFLLFLLKSKAYVMLNFLTLFVKFIDTRKLLISLRLVVFSRQ